ncbi:MAG: shikimate dehydrogenase [Rhodobacteraceae bacterium]|nr:shikimate dehydrogenase [Paracoccaceae bacterium]
MKVLRAGLIGDHISQTRLPAALEIMCKAAGLILEFELIDTADRSDFDFANTVDALHAKGWSGVTVTHPFKTHAAEYAGRAMPAQLRKLGASNTLIFDRGLKGVNTDYTGFLSAWKTHMGDQSAGIVAMAGAGGVARAIGPALAELGASEIRIWDMSERRAKDLADLIGAPARVVAANQAHTAIIDANGLVNATPLGMTYHPGSAFCAALIGAQSWAFDAVYTPTDTEFLRACSRAGLVTLTGFDLFRHMSIDSFQAYTGITVDRDIIMPKLATLCPPMV